jgi:uncharacterized glyoxalase superfamily protein PhnB
MNVARTGAAIIPTMRYRDAPGMIEWLGRAFGFERHLVVPDGGGGVAHAQLVLGNGMIMLGSVRDDDFGRMQTQPGATTTQSPYLVVADPDAIHARALAEGAEIVIALHDPEYGGRHFSCRDPEGHLWHLGSYDPWETEKGNQE